jgi:hypothetical protein
MKKIGVVVAIFLTTALLLTACSNDQKAVDDVISQIDSITKVSLSSGDRIEKAEKAYGALSKKQKEKVTNYEALKNARTLYDTMWVYKDAVDECNDQVQAYNDRLLDYDSKIREVEEVNLEFSQYIQQIRKQGILEAEAYDPKTITDLQKAVDEAEKAIAENTPEQIPWQLPVNQKNIVGMSVSQITEETDKVEAVKPYLDAKGEALEESINSVVIPDYTKEKADLEEKLVAAEYSVASLQQVTDPKEDFVLSRLSEVDTVISLAPATSEQDPFGKLKKANGYLVCVFFQDSRVKEYAPVSSESELLSIGKEAGGCIEVYRIKEQAEKRDADLKEAAGQEEHLMLGTCIIRPSTYLTAEQQKDLEDTIKDVFLRVDPKE